MIKLLNKINTPITVLFFIIIIFYQLFFYDKTFFFRDLSVQDLPQTNFVMNSIKSGVFPLWNHELFSGFQQFASVQPPMIYPIIYIYLFFKFDTALNLFIISHIFISFFGVYLIGKKWGLNKTASLIGGSIYGLNSYVFEHNNLQYILAAISWLPYIFLYSEKLLFVVSKKNFILFSVFSFLQLSTGRFDYYYFSMMLIVPYLIYKIYINKTDREILSKNLVYFSFSILFPILLTAIQIIPTYEFLQNTRRSVGMTFEGVTIWSLNPLQLFSLIFSNLFGDIFTDTGFWRILSNRKDPTFYVYNIYMGANSLILIIYFLFSKKRMFLFLFFISIIFTIISLGKYSFLYEILYKYMPLFKSIRFPMKMFIIPIFLFSLLSMISFDELFKLEEKKKIIKYYTSINILLVSFTITILYFLGHLWFINPSIRSLIYTNIFIFIFLALLKINSKKLSVLYLLLVLSDLSINNINNLWITNKTKLYNNHELGAILKKNIGNNNSYHFLKDKKVEGLVKYNGNRIIHFFELDMKKLDGNLSLDYNLSNISAYYPTEPSKISYLLELLRDENKNFALTNKEKIDLLKNMNVKLYLDNNSKSLKFDKENANEIKEIKELGIKIWEVKNTYPKIQFKNKALLIDNEERIEEIFIKNRFDKDSLLILKKESNKNINNFINISKKDKTFIKIISKSANKIKIDINTNSSGFLVIGNNYDSGWKAYDNGVKTILFNADYYKQAIKITSGKHIIELTYKPFSFVVGFIISLISFLILITICIRDIMKKLLLYKFNLSKK